MNGREALEALERELHGQVERISIHSPAYWPLVAVLEAVHNSALASKDAGPSADVPNTVPSQEGAGSAGGLADRDMGDLVNTVSRLERECERLHAWEKWGRLHAKPALEKYKGSYVGRSVLGYEQYFADNALLALPGDKP